MNPQAPAFLPSKSLSPIGNWNPPKQPRSQQTGGLPHRPSLPSKPDFELFDAWRAQLISDLTALKHLCLSLETTGGVYTEPGTKVAMHDKQAGVLATVRIMVGFLQDAIFGGFHPATEVSKRAHSAVRWLLPHLEDYVDLLNNVTKLRKPCDAVGDGQGSSRLLVR